LVFDNPIGKIFKRMLIGAFEAECWLASKWVSAAHRRLKFSQWAIPPSPRNVDHRIDLYSDWLRSRNSVWVERGVFNRLCLRGGDVLELTCGDGFNTRNFYSLHSRSIVACDIDACIIRTARRKNAAANIEYRVSDIVREFPRGRYQNVIWDFGYPITEFFSPEDLAAIFGNVRSSLEPGGIFSGYTMAEDAANEFTDAGPEGRMLEKEQLVAMLMPYFKHVAVFETASPGRKNFYFCASDDAAPFSSMARSKVTA
jgi:SAM-dependent methyltransferase